jgi:hypothetical protein
MNSKTKNKDQIYVFYYYVIFYQKYVFIEFSPISNNSENGLNIKSLCFLNILTFLLIILLELLGLLSHKLIIRLFTSLFKLLKIVFPVLSGEFLELVSNVFAGLM